MKIKMLFWAFAFFLLSSSFVFSQTSSTMESEKELATQQVEEALKGNDLEKQAESYYNLGMIYFKEENYSKAELYFQKSLNLYEKLKQKDKISLVSRKLAQAQEQQKKLDLAYSNYNYAASNSPTLPIQQSANINDANRVKSRNPKKQEEQIRENIKLNIKLNNEDELLTSYSQLVENQIAQGDNKEVVKSLDSAYALARNSSSQMAINFNSKKAEVYKNLNNLDKAIEVKKEILQEDFVKKDSKTEAQQLQELAELYTENNDWEEALNTLKNAYTLSIQKGHTVEAQRTVQKMDSIFQSQNAPLSSLKMYRQFLIDLPQTMDKDSTFLNEKVLKETEEKIQILENESVLNAQIFRQKNILNYSLIGLLILGIGFLAMMFINSQKLKKQNKKIALQSMRKDMNPHFIFNSLNSINQYIAQNNEKEANNYLTQFSTLMRSVLDHSQKDFINLEEEINLLQNYLALEHKRFQNQFEYEFTVDPELKNQDIEIPVMMVQPFVENAIGHGLRYLKDKGNLKVDFAKKGDRIEISIEDNGIGIDESEKQKTNHQKKHQGIGMKNTEKRIEYLNDLYGKNIEYQVIKLSPGTRVILSYTI